MPSLQSYSRARTVLNLLASPCATPLIVGAVGLLAATATLSRYIVGYILLEALYLISQHIRCYPQRSQSIRNKVYSVPRIGLCKDILLALDSESSLGVDKWLGAIFEVSVKEVKRDNVEELLSEAIFDTPLKELRTDALKYHALYQAITELEIRRNKRFPSGYNTEVTPLVQGSYEAQTHERPKLLLEVSFQAVMRLASHWLLLILGFRSTGISTLSYRKRRNPGQADDGETSTMVISGSAWGWWRMLPTIMNLRHKTAGALYLLDTATSSFTNDGTSRSLDVSLDDVLAPEDRTREPIRVVDRECIFLASNLIKPSPKVTLVLIDPPIHPLLAMALGSDTSLLTNKRNGGDISSFSSSGCLARVILTPSMCDEESRVIKRYCELESILLDSVSSTRSLVQIISEANKAITHQRSSAVDDPITRTIEIEVITEEEPAPSQTASLMNTYAMMSTLENISSIGMCLAPPLRTRQRSKSMGTVVGYGHVDGLRRPSMVAAMS